jgi:hypothetical protein
MAGSTESTAAELAAIALDNAILYQSAQSELEVLVIG